MKYRDMVQQKLREESVLKAIQQANECGENCKYSEEQIIEAQKQLGKRQLNQIYNELIHPISNAILYPIYTLATLVLMPIVYVYDTKVTIVAAITAFILILVFLIVFNIVENSVKKDMGKNREWMKYLNKFVNDTYGVGYILTSIGYLTGMLDSEIFWYLYTGIVVMFIIAIYFDLIKPLVISLRKHFKTTKTKCRS